MCIKTLKKEKPFVLRLEYITLEVPKNNITNNFITGDDMQEKTQKHFQELNSVISKICKFELTEDPKSFEPFF